MNNRQQLLQNMAQAIAERGLATPAIMLLDIAAPFAIVAGQAALFLRPFAPDERWRAYASLFEDSASWQELGRLLRQQHD